MSDVRNLAMPFYPQQVRATLDASAEDVRAGRIADLRPQLAGLRRRLAKLEANIEAEAQAAAAPGR